jgi:hypothetical protein
MVKSIIAKKKCQCQGKNCQWHEWYDVVEEEMLAFVGVGF